MTMIYADRKPISIDGVVSLAKRRLSGLTEFHQKIEGSYGQAALKEQLEKTLGIEGMTFEEAQNIMAILLKDFEARNPGVKVIVYQCPEGGNLVYSLALKIPMAEEIKRTETFVPSSERPGDPIWDHI